MAARALPSPSRREITAPRKPQRADGSDVRYAVKRLDAVRKCGAGTSVQVLYRVDARGKGRAECHLVYFDRHGWYCEHGRGCEAVAAAREFDRRDRPR